MILIVPIPTTLMTGAWVLRDSYGRVLRLTVPRHRGAPLVYLPANVGSVLDCLVEDALAPPATASNAVTSDLLEICRVLIGHDLALEYAFRDAGETGWRRRFELVHQILTNAVVAGWLLCERSQASTRWEIEEAPATLRDPPFSESASTTWFELRVVDHAGEALSGLEIALTTPGGRVLVKTSQAGIARFEDSAGSFGTAELIELGSVREILEQRAERFRPVRIPEGKNVTVQTLRALTGVRLESETPHTLVISPHNRRVRLVGMHFDKSKCFLLPSAMRGIQKVKAIYDETGTNEILVVGHTDARGDVSYNEQLSLERAEAIVAFMADDAAAWDTWFSSEREEKRWGSREVNLMLSAIVENEPTFNADATDTGAATVERFQRWSNSTRGTTLRVDGIAGSKTRRALIEAYMALDRTSLPPGAKITAHGCGPHQPPHSHDDPPGEMVDHRRVDIFAFEGRISPPVPGPISRRDASEYPAWVAQMSSTEDVRTNRLLLRVWLKNHRRDAMPSTPFRIRIGSYSHAGHADDLGAIFIDLTGTTIDTHCLLEWGEMPAGISIAADSPYPYQRQLFLDVRKDHPDGAERALHNLGYSEPFRARAIATFEEDYRRPAADLHEVHWEGFPSAPSTT